jgi:hypothetical protein
MIRFMEHLLLRWFRAGLGVPSLAAKLEEKNLFRRSSGTLRLSGFVSLRNQFLWDESNANNQSTQQYRFLHVLPPQKFLY